MKKYDIHIDDLMRILQGNVPWPFYLELVIRALAVYLIIIVALRLMGKRMGKLFTRNEVAAVSTLSAAIGIPLQSPDRGLLPGVLIAGIVVLFQRGVAALAAKKQPFERLTQGRISTLVADCVLHTSGMKECHLSRERIFAQLRGRNIYHLGEVQRLYLEANGSFTLIRHPQPAPGLCVLPETDTAFINELPVHTDKKVCSYCGIAQPQPQTPHCPNCNSTEWTTARG